MTLTRFVKVIAYAVLTVLALCWALWTAGPLYAGGEPVRAYLRSDLLLFIAACTLTGIGVYSWLAYTRRLREHRADSLFFFILGMLVMLITVVVVLRFGGLSEENFDPASTSMINLNLMLAGLLPVPLLVRTWILVPGCEKGVKRLIGAVAALVPTAAYLALIAAGKLLHTVSYTG